MTVAELRQLLAELPDDLPVYVNHETFDLNRVEFVTVTDLFNLGGYICIPRLDYEKANTFRAVIVW